MTRGLSARSLTCRCGCCSVTRASHLESFIEPAAALSKVRKRYADDRGRPPELSGHPFQEIK